MHYYDVTFEEIVPSENSQACYQVYASSEKEAAEIADRGFLRVKGKKVRKITNIKLSDNPYILQVPSIAISPTPIASLLDSLTVEWPISPHSDNAIRNYEYRYIAEGTL